MVIKTSVTGYAGFPEGGNCIPMFKQHLHLEVRVQEEFELSRSGTNCSY